jgi:hypothetical protein
MKKTYVLEIDLPDDPAVLDDPKKNLLDILGLSRERGDALSNAAIAAAVEAAKDVIEKDKAEGKRFSTYNFNAIRSALEFLDSGLTGNEIFFLFFQGYTQELRERNAMLSKMERLLNRASPGIGDIRILLDL